MVDMRGDVRDLEALREAFMRAQPTIVFHLAAQPLVRRSFVDPKETFDTNIGGTVNVLETLRQLPSVKAAVLITSDKCYRNHEWTWGYRESDELGGDDPYSASKGAAELVARSYINSFFRDSKLARVATARAGNVIGGGDWAQDRVVPDCVRAWSQNQKPAIRSPLATRPWQHVLEPLSGYLWLGAALLERAELCGEPFNFGPAAGEAKSVRDLLTALKSEWPGVGWGEEQSLDDGRESRLLKLCCDKALHQLDWRSTLNFEETAHFTCSWYKSYYSDKESVAKISRAQIREYASLAAERGLVWAR